MSAEPDIPTPLVELVSVLAKHQNGDQIAAELGVMLRVDGVPADVIRCALRALAEGWSGGGGFSIEVHNGPKGHPKVRIVMGKTITVGE